MLLTIEIIKPGMLTTIQDSGRTGLAYYAIPPAGPLDGGAARLANLLVTNTPGQPVLECNFIGPQIQFQEPALISLTGAYMPWRVNGEPVNRNTSLLIPAGGILQGGHAKEGVRAYIAIRGKWQLRKILGSYSTYAAAQMGGLNGRPLQRGDQINIQLQEQNDIREISIEQNVHYHTIHRIGFYPGPEWEIIGKALCTQFTKIDYAISPNSNRTGAKLSGQPLRVKQFRQLSSSGVFPGVIQLPGDGLPIVLLNDCPTTGGYPRIGVIPEEELWLFNQIRPGSLFRFYNVKP